MGAFGITAKVVGTFHRPLIKVTLARRAEIRDGKPALVWVKGLPDRRWDPDLLCWWVTGLGRDPVRTFQLAGIELDVTAAPTPTNSPCDPSAANVAAILAELSAPVVRADRDHPGQVVIRPRLVGPTHVATFVVPMAELDEGTGRMHADLLDLVDPDTRQVRAGLGIDPFLEAEALEAYAARVLDVRAARERHIAEAARLAALSPSFTRSGVDGRADSEVAEGPGSALAVLNRATGGVPEWFGLDLYEYQQLAVGALLVGRSLVADSPGAGKTRTALAAAANVLEREVIHFHHGGFVDAASMRYPQGPGAATGRVLIVVPPVVLTHWARETVESNLGVSDPASKASWWPPDLVPTTGSPAESGSVCVVVQPGRRMPVLPDRGVVVVADSILASRPALVDELVEWSPSVVVYDEAHRARTWTSTRSVTMRSLIDRIRTTRTADLGATWGSDPDPEVQPLPAVTVLPLTGTPMFTGSPVELIPLLAMTGQLDWVFGGRAAFAQRFCWRDHFGRWVGRKQAASELRRLLDQHVWVRRHKADILPWLPEKRWLTSYVDVAMADVRAARTGLEDAVADWLDGRGDGEPTDTEIEQWCRSQIGLLSPLRRATGMAKVPAAAEHIDSWLAENPPRHDADGRWFFDEPLVMWAHHRDVIAALADYATRALESRLGTSLPPVGVIDGSTGLDRRTRLVDELQAHHLGVLVCQITAAGVGLTLTACASPLFVESDWTAPLMSQAEDRHHRPGQNRGVTLTALCATGTLDEHVVKVRNAKEDQTVAIVGDRQGRATRDEMFEASRAVAPWEILAGIVRDVAARRRRNRGSRKAA